MMCYNCGHEQDLHNLRGAENICSACEAEQDECYHFEEQPEAE